MNNIISYKNKDVGVLGLGLSGLAATKVLLNSKANIFVFDDKIKKPEIIKKTTWRNYKLWPWESLNTLIVTPGIPINATYKHSAIKLALENNVKIINEIDLFFETKPKAKIIGITGTNGKSTTAALLLHILKFNKIKCVLGGNYGFPACSIVDPGKNGVIILELSSYQLDGAKKLNLDFASILNITPDHLDYHGSFEKYINCKLKIFNFLNKNGTIIFDNKNKLLNKIINPNNYKSLNFVKTSNSKNYYAINDNNYLKGIHNSTNASIAISFAKNLNLKKKEINSAIQSFKGLPHRMEPLYSSEKIQIINDSKSTNGDSTAAALSSFNNIFWIVGGQPKTDGIGQAKNFLGKVVEVFLIGSSTNFFSKEISKVNNQIPLNHCFTLKNATKLAIARSKICNLDNCVILLSPSAASFDQFKNFEDRGEKFKKIVAHHINESST